MSFLAEGTLCVLRLIYLLMYHAFNFLLFCSLFRLNLSLTNSFDLELIGTVVALLIVKLLSNLNNYLPIT